MERFLITGATGGLGSQLVEKLKARDVRLFLHGRNESKLREIADGHPIHASDLIPPGAAEELVERARNELGGIDCVIHCVGAGLIRPVSDTSDGEFSKILNVNARVTYLVAKYACAAMAENRSGLFLTFPGILGKAVMKNASAYIASKFAVTGMIKAFAQEYQRSGIRFGLFYFGGIDSPFWDPLDMKVMREKMIPAATAAAAVLQAIDLPGHLVLNELTLQPDTHQLG